jgi:hypothetical protein
MEDIVAILRSLEGKFYDIPDEDAHKYEVPREQVKDLLAKAGGPPPAGGHGGPGHGGPGHGGPHGGPTPPVVINVFAGGGGPGGGAPGGGGPGGGAPGGGGPGGGGAPEGDVDPYWWWWNNYWPNWWGNY